MYMNFFMLAESEIMGIASLMKDRCVTAGRDRTVRLWKVSVCVCIYIYIYIDASQPAETVQCACGR